MLFYGNPIDPYSPYIIYFYRLLNRRLISVVDTNMEDREGMKISPYERGMYFEQKIRFE